MAGSAAKPKWYVDTCLSPRFPKVWSPAWMDVEGDEATFTKTNEADGDQSKPIRWEQWLGLVERGRPNSLILERLNPPRTYKRAPGPGAVRRVEWKHLAMKHLRNRRVVFHTDSAKSYKLRVDGVLHDRVVHAKKRVLVKGKFIWKAPDYVKVVEHRGARSPEAAQGEGRDPDHRSGLALHERSNFPESAYPGRDHASAEQNSFSTVRILETRHRPLARDWEPLHVGHAELRAAHVIEAFSSAKISVLTFARAGANNRKHVCCIHA